nr:EOG090X03TX [Polyphemus pediculus]
MQAFNVAVQALLSSQKQSIAAQSAASGEHLAFFGSGREIEDQYVHMVVAFFLQRHVQFVGLVQGGFQAVHEALVSAQKENNGGATSAAGNDPVGLVDHNPNLCLVCSSHSQSKDKINNDRPAVEKTSSSSQQPPKSDFFERIRSKSALVKEKLVDYIVNPNVIPEQSDPTSANKDSSPSSVKPKGVSGNKLYRNLAPVFTIDDDQESDNSTSLEGVSEKEGDTPNQELVAISSWLNKPDVINSFRCHEVKESGHAFSSYLLITPSNMYALREIQDRPGFARISVNRALTSIMKITSKKRHPEFITFKYGTLHEEETIITDMDRFVIPQAGDAVKLVKQQLFNCGSLS